MASKKLYEQPPKDLIEFVEQRTKYIDITNFGSKTKPAPGRRRKTGGKKPR